MENVSVFMGIIAPYINFCLFAFLAFRLFKKPIVSALKKQREEYISTSKEADEALKAAQDKHDELKSELDKLGSVIESMKSKAEEDAKNETKAMIDQAEGLALHLKEEAKRIADAEIKRAKETLQEDIILSVRESVAKKISSELDDESQKHLVQKRMDSLRNIHMEA